MKHFINTILFLSLAIDTIGQKTLFDSDREKESFAIAEFGGASGLSLTNGRWNFGPSIAIEVTPIENWLELELGVTPAFGVNLNELAVDLLIKKPWTLSQKVEFMIGAGPVWTHSSDHEATSNSVGGELALDFMFWPYKKHRIGWYVEPEYDYNFSKGHEQSIGISGGLLVAIP
jgi:hypothetical protein